MPNIQRQCFHLNTKTPRAVETGLCSVPGVTPGLGSVAGARWLGLMPSLPCACSLSLIVQDGFSANGQAWCLLQRRHGGLQACGQMAGPGGVHDRREDLGGGAGCSDDHLKSAAAGCVTGLSLGPVDAGTLSASCGANTVWVTIVTGREGSGQQRPPE